ncbi:hypothetical protein PV569_13130 [Streptomyces scabiei]|uniref:hypothetical protein n=1 Tax=Streptomyces scabiei TaxID=1930 RepID=UPI0029ADD8D4|nr:hypothetical protein [Streptomyces scabiei]MDX3294650.1 hypothetical protein [Streptomyces scabiei]
MTRVEQLPGCPYGGCENGYCACLERDVEDLEISGEEDPEDAELAAAIRAGAEVMTGHGRIRLVETLSLDNYPPATTEEERPW